jgi:predicted DNA-binding transcriptional regulator YafY
MLLTIEEIEILLQALAAAHGPGYASDPAVAKLQAKLSMMLEAKRRVADALLG